MRRTLLLLLVAVALVGGAAPSNAAARLAPIYGHRCHPGNSENTLYSVRTVDARMRHPACEVDTWRLADGTFIVIHDPTWTRTIDPATIPDGTPERVEDATWEQVAQMRTKGGQVVPTLDRLLTAADKRDVRILLEVMNWPPVDILTAHPRVRAYRQPQPANDCNTAQITELHDAGIATGIKIHDECPMSLEDLQALGVDLAAYGTEDLLADDASLIHVLIGTGIAPITRLVGDWLFTQQVLEAGGRVIVPDPAATERLWRKAQAAAARS